MLEVIYKKSEKIPWRIIESEGVLVHIDKGEVIHLNFVAARIWELIDGKLSMKEIYKKLLDEYDVSENLLYVDLCEFFQELISKGIINEVS